MSSKRPCKPCGNEGHNSYRYVFLYLFAQTPLSRSYILVIVRSDEPSHIFKLYNDYNDGYMCLVRRACLGI